MAKKIRVGSRESRLAVIQSEYVMRALKQRFPEYEPELITMKTAGDLTLDKPLDRIGGKGLFTKELDNALFEGRLDAAVHSLKDVPIQLADRLIIRAYCKRADPRDALVLPAGQTEPDMSKPAGCSSKRRRMQFRGLYPDWAVEDVRGNVLTRLEKLDRGEYGGLVLAAAGLKRLGLARRIYRLFEPDEMIPPAGQGTLAVITKDTEEWAFIALLDDPASRCCAAAERSFVKTLDGGCGGPIAGYAVVEDGVITVTGLYGSEETGAAATGSVSGAADTPEILGKILAFKLLARCQRTIGNIGKVWLVGAGPGDPGLLTFKADAALRRGDTVLFDHLVGKGVLSRIPPDAELVYVGKRSGRPRVSQEEINMLLLQKAALGKQVVRLKGGDPFLFGRGGEELALLKTAEIPFEVVPGVSSALAVPAYAGIPASHRDYCSQVHIITGHGREAKQYAVDYEGLVKTGGTCIFLMGVGALKSICQGLLAAGMPADTPGAVIEQGTTAKQRQVTAPLSRLAHTAEAASIKAPGLIIIGGVCGLSAALSWRMNKPLAGVRIAVNGLQNRASRLQNLLSAEGAEVVNIPTIYTLPILETPALEQLFKKITGKEWFVFTSPTGVEVFFDKLKVYHQDIRILQGVKFAAVGKTTAGMLEERGLRVDLVPGQFSGGGLGNGLRNAVAPGEPVMLLRSRTGTDSVIRLLAYAGIPATDIPIYDTLPLNRYHDPAYRELLTEQLDWIAFASPSAAEGFAAAFGVDGLGSYNALCIGEQTAQAAAGYGMKTYTAENGTFESMVETLKIAVSGDPLSDH
jgi:uroporphyrinogen III methyltransferase/synthase